MLIKTLLGRRLFIGGAVGGVLLVAAAVYFPLAAVLGWLPFSGEGSTPENIEILLDRSAAMRKPFEAGTKLSEATRAINKTILVEDVAWGDYLALRQYGGPCERDNTRLLVEFNQNNRSLVQTELQQIEPEGESTLARGILEGMGDFRSVGNGRNTIIAVTARGDSCQPEVAGKLISQNNREAGRVPELRVIVIGAEGEVPPPWIDEEGAIWVDNGTELEDTLGDIWEEINNGDGNGDGEPREDSTPAPPPAITVSRPNGDGTGGTREPDSPNGTPGSAPVGPLVEVDDLHLVSADQPYVPVDLNGLWEDEKGRAVRINQTGPLVLAEFVEEPFVCEHRDGTGQRSETGVNFTASVEGDRLSGTITVCNWGESHPYGDGIGANPFQMSIGQGGKELSGTWQDLLTGEAKPAALTRMGCSPLLPEDLGLPGASRVHDYVGLPVPDTGTGASVERYHLGLHFISQDSSGVPARRRFTAGVSGVADLVVGSRWNTINVHMANGNTLQYLHASRVDVADGQAVGPDTVLGVTGNVGPGEDVGAPGRQVGLLHVQARNAEGAFIHPDCARP